MDAIERGLLKAIVENPDDDVSRLAYADWLEENAQQGHDYWGHGKTNHAGIIRYQLKNKKLDERAKPVSDLIDNLLSHANKGQHWVADLLRMPQGSLCRWERGFPTHLSVHGDHPNDRPRGADLRPAIKTALELCPLRSVRMHYPNEADLVCLAAQPGLARVEKLEVVGVVGAAAATALAHSPYVCGLRELDLHECGLKDEAAVALAGSPHFRSLESLRLDGNAMGTGARAFASAKLPRLRALRLENNSIPLDALEDIAVSPGLPELKEYVCWGNELTGESAHDRWRALAQAVSERTGGPGR